MRRIALGALVIAANAAFATGLEPTNAPSHAAARDPFCITPFVDSDHALTTHAIDESQVAAYRFAVF